MAFHLNPNCIVVSLETWLSTSDEIRSITKDLQLNMLNIGYKHDLLQLKEVVFWPLTYSLSVTNKAWKHVSQQVMKFLYRITTYLLSVVIMGLNITCS